MVDPVTTLDVRSPARSTTSGNRYGLATVAALVTVATLCFTDVTAVRLIHAAPPSGTW